MHERNPYQDPKRLLWLAEKDTKLAKYINKKHKYVSVNWDDEEVKRTVSEAILRHDFGIDVRLSSDRLCPSVPNRLNYVLWIEDLVNSLHWYDCQDPSYARGIDIGTGSIAIYACLACKRNPLWSIVGTDIDADAIEHAKRTLDGDMSRCDDCKVTSTAQLRSRIQLIHTHGSFLDMLHLDEQYAESHESRQKVAYHFSMCNPPFYASQEERQESTDKKQVAKTWTAGSQHELYTPGGELAFILRLFEESQQWCEQIVWYSSMLGKLTSVYAFVDHLRGVKHSNYAVTELVQGRTKRWVVAWSFRGSRLPDSLGRGIPKIAPASTLRAMQCEHLLNEHNSTCTTAQFLSSLDITTSEGVHSHPIHANDSQCFALDFFSPVWTRSARRKRARLESCEIQNDRPILAVNIWHASNKLHIQWTYGMDRALFDSFSVHVFYQLRNRLSTMLQSDELSHLQPASR
ncbi:hypothetical protein MPSI1_002894 [Malassezia psittaci]|uniref:U6 small nuclear RNA (adenine-(43)-N(6))-methyltransferase n=1 Tax=Malassezia psittaci TaxID=1821823 RepID=A0AAF0FGN5_9BASI|nr:hypothetical protein MPSI1_002894 [Malassezia psittaci]